MRIYATTSAAAPNGDRVLPFQGVNDLFGTSSQGVALGYRVLAPLTRMINEPWIGNESPSPAGAQSASPGRHPGNATNKSPSPGGAQFVNQGRRPGNTTNKSPSPEGAQSVSPGQRPGNTVKNKMISPERALPGYLNAQTRELKQTIAANVAEILEA